MKIIWITLAVFVIALVFALASCATKPIRHWSEDGWEAPIKK